MRGKTRLIVCFIMLGLFAAAIVACGVTKGSLSTREKESIEKTPSPAPRPTSRPTPPPEPTPQPFPPTEPTVNPAWPRPTPTPEKQQRLYIDTDPDAAAVYLDGKYYGLSPLTIRSLDSGIYALKIEKPGFQTLSIWLNYNEDAQSFYYRLTERRGLLDVTIIPPDADISISGKKLTGGFNSLPVGNYTVSFSRFGYKRRTAGVTIGEDAVTTLRIELAKAVFVISGLSLSRQAFNPNSTGPLATVTLTYQVSAAGQGSVTIKNERDETMFVTSPLTFHEQPQRFQWDGRNVRKEIVPDGRYTIVVRGSGDGSSAASEERVTVVVDSALNPRLQTLWSGTPGLFYVSAPEVLPSGNFQLSTYALAFLEADGNLFSPVSVGLRAGLGDSQELDVSVASIFTHDAPPTLNATVAYRLSLLVPKQPVDLGAGVYAKLTYQFRYRADLFSNPTGFSIGLPVQVDLGSFHLIAGPELTASYTKVTYDPGATLADGVYVWLYGRFGLYWEESLFRIGASVSFRSLPFDEGFGIALPIQAALEATLYVPDSPLYITVGGILEFESADSFWGLAGLGFGLLW